MLRSSPLDSLGLTKPLLPLIQIPARKQLGFDQKPIFPSFAAETKLMGGEGKVFALSDVAEHNTFKDCWLVVDGKVYDVTKFLEDHPGGDEVLLSATGKDATDDFEDVGHSSTAKAMMDEFYVGDIDKSTILTEITYTPPKQPYYNQDKTPEFIIKLLQFLAPLIILGLAFAVRFYTKSAPAA